MEECEYYKCLSLPLRHNILLVDINEANKCSNNNRKRNTFWTYSDHVQPASGLQKSRNEHSHYSPIPMIYSEFSFPFPFRQVFQMTFPFSFSFRQFSLRSARNGNKITEWWEWEWWFAIDPARGKFAVFYVRPGFGKFPRSSSPRFKTLAQSPIISRRRIYLINLL